MGGKLSMRSSYAYAFCQLSVEGPSLTWTQETSATLHGFYTYTVLIICVEAVFHMDGIETPTCGQPSPASSFSEK